MTVGATRNSTPTVVGLADAQTHVIKAWLPHYRVHSAQSLEIGAWQVYQNFLIHDGPDDTSNEVYASIGCIEICGAPRGFDAFNAAALAQSFAQPGKNDPRYLAASKVLTRYVVLQKERTVLVIYSESHARPTVGKFLDGAAASGAKLWGSALK